MASNDELLEDVAGAILDGTPIDWAAVEARAKGHPLLIRLKVLSELANLHRDPSHDSLTPNEKTLAGSSDALDEPRGRLGRWGHLKLLERIGSGAFGHVYRAHDTRLDRDVALKLLPAHGAAGKPSASAIIDEGRLLARVRHPNVVIIHGAEQIDDQVGLLMELVKGRTLEQMLEQGKRFSVAETVEIGIQLSYAIAAVHEAGLLHRDIKSHNVMLADDGRVVLMDFGTGWEVTDSTHANLAGTPLYLAPELLDGKEASIGSDIYALGVLLYHLLTGVYPVVGAQKIRDLQSALERGERVDLRKLRSDVPRKVASIIERAIDPRPERRYESGAAMATHLRASHGRLTRSSWVALFSLALVVGVLVAVPALRRAGGSSPVSAVRPQLIVASTPVTSTPGTKAHPALSPDGTRVAFAWWNPSGESEIYVKDLAADKTTQITRTVGGENYPTWSPDGRFLAFNRLYRDHDGKPASALLIIPAAGGQERVIWQGVGGLLGPGLDWSPDGSQIAVSMRASVGQQLRLLLLDVATQGTRWITVPPPSGVGDNRPVFSPDGASLAFVRNTGSESGLHVLQLATADLLRLPVGGHDIRAMTWAEDGRALVFTSFQGGGRDRLWRISTAGGVAEPVAGIGEGATFPSIARSGGRMVYLQQLIDSNLYRVDLTVENGGAAQPLAHSTRMDASPDVSPDGSRIAFASNRTGSFEIWRVDADGGNARQLTEFRTLCAHPRWSSDGQQIVFSARPSTADRKSIYVLDASTGASRRISTGPSEDDVPTWSADGRSIYFASLRSGGPRQIWRIAAQGGEPVQITRDGGAKAWESSDGRFLYYGDDTPAIWRMPAGGGQPTVVFRLPAGTAYGGEWVLTGPGIYWLNDRVASRPAIELFAFATGRSVPSTTLAGPYDDGSGFSVSKDGRWVVFSQRDYHGADIMMVQGFR